MRKIVLPDKRYYTIGEVAQAFDVNPSLLRFWEKEFDVLKPKKNEKGTRRFTPEDIKNLKLIYFLVREEGYTLDGARKKLEQNFTQTVNRFEIINRLKKIKSELKKINKHL